MDLTVITNGPDVKTWMVFECLKGLSWRSWLGTVIIEHKGVVNSLFWGEDALRQNQGLWIDQDSL
jgi:hypothetical protein